MHSTWSRPEKKTVRESVSSEKSRCAIFCRLLSRIILGRFGPGKVRILVSTKDCTCIRSVSGEGVGVPSNTLNEAYVVVEKRFDSNELIVAFDRLDTEGLYARRCRIGSLSFTNRIAAGAAQRLRLNPDIARRQRLYFLKCLGKNLRILEFDQPQRALTPGQICALYDGEHLLGGGVFEEIF